MESIYAIDFMRFVEDEWNLIIVHGRGDFVLKQKLGLLNHRLKWWNINVFGKFDLEVEEKEKVLNEVDEIGVDVYEKDEKFKKESNNLWLNLKIK